MPPPPPPPSRSNKVKQEQKHLGLVLDSGLTFRSHVRERIISGRSGIGVIRFLSKYVIGVIRFLSKHVIRDVLDQIYKLYVLPHFDYGDIIQSLH